ncbi:MAG: alpha/beta hydrolase [Pseudomonadota bacterium]
MSVERLTSGGEEVVVEITEGREPAVLWLSGFRSDMAGGKAIALKEWGERTGRRVVRFDYRGHGVSGGVFEDFVLSDWLADTHAVYQAHCNPGTVALGSSMGGWIGLLLARDLFAKGTPLAGLVLIAPAPDFAERLMWPRLPDDLRQSILREGIAHLPSDYGEPTPVTRRLFEDGRKNLLFTDEPIRTGCPVHILQGVEDLDVPPTHALKLIERLAEDDVVLTLIKDGDHRLSRPQDIERMLAAVEGVA